MAAESMVILCQARRRRNRPSPANISRSSAVVGFSDAERRLLSNNQVEEYMQQLVLRNLDISDRILRPLAEKYIWWLTADEAMRIPSRVAAQVMNIGDYEDVHLAMMPCAISSAMRKSTSSTPAHGHTGITALTCAT